MQGSTRVVKIKKNSNKIIDLPIKNKKINRSIHKKQLANMIKDFIYENQIEVFLNKKEEPNMDYGNIEELVNRALCSKACVMPDGMKGYYDLVETIYENPTETLEKYYPLFDDGVITSTQKKELEIAELTIKYKMGKEMNIVGDWLVVQPAARDKRIEALKITADFIEKVMKKDKSMFKTTNDNGFCTHSEKVGILSSLVASTLVGVGKMFMNDDFSKTEILKTAGAAVLSGAVTKLTLSNVIDNELSGMASVGVGGGIGLVIGGGVSFGLDMIANKLEESTDNLELPVPAED